MRLREKQILDSVLGPKVYDRRIRPGSAANATDGKTLNDFKLNICTLPFFSVHMAFGLLLVDMMIIKQTYD